MKWLNQLNWYTYSGSYLNVRAAIVLILFAMVFAVGGYMMLEDYTFREAIYMTVITLSTVGYTEVRPLSETGQLFTTILITINFGVVAYVLAVFSSLVIEGQLFKDIHIRSIEYNIKKMKNHIIVCGYGRYGSEIVEHLLNNDIPFVVIERDNAKIEEIQKSDKKILYIHDDATQDEALVQAQIDQAQALITTFPDDSDNLFTVFSARHINPKLQIISAAREIKTEKKLRKAGADHVMMPDKLGGYYMATIISKPNAREFFAFISDEGQANVEFDEIMYEHFPQKYHGKSISALALRKHTGANIIGLKSPSGLLEINPEPSTVLKSGSSFIVIGTKKQMEALKKFLQH